MKPLCKALGLLTLFFILIPSLTLAQFLQNPSLEGPPGESQSPSGWSGCNSYSTPDTQPGGWNVFASPSAGNSYISLVGRGNNGIISDRNTEDAQTRLLSPLRLNKCYRFALDLAISNTFFSNVPFITPLKLKVWIGGSSCEKSELVWESPAIDNPNWQRYSFIIGPKVKESHYLILEASYVGNTFYNGNILIDNLSLTEEPVNVNLGLDGLFCPGNQVVLNAGAPNVPNAQYLWNDGSTGSTLTVTTPGTKWLEVKVGNCVIRDEVVFRTVDPITKDLGRDTVLCFTSKYELDATIPDGEYLWEDNSTSPSRTIYKSGTYRVKISNGCYEKTDEITLLFSDDCCKVESFDIFTPNADNLNDEFKFKSVYQISNYHLKIYNRWGALLFESKDLDKGWDGKHNGSATKDGVYFWYVTYSCTENRLDARRTMKGIVTLVR